jgi:hypothetical protein
MTVSLATSSASVTNFCVALVLTTDSYPYPSAVFIYIGAYTGGGGPWNSLSNSYCGALFPNAVTNAQLSSLPPGDYWIWVGLNDSNVQCAGTIFFSWNSYGSPSNVVLRSILNGT